MCLKERSNAYEKALREKSKIIRQTEMGNMKQKGRSASLHLVQYMYLADVRDRLADLP